MIKLRNFFVALTTVCTILTIGLANDDGFVYSIITGILMVVFFLSAKVVDSLLPEEQQLSHDGEVK